MAIIRTYKPIPNETSPFEEAVSNRTATSFTASGPGSVANWTGIGFTYDAQGRPAAGTLTDLSWKTGGSLTMTITGMNATIAALKATNDHPSTVLWRSAEI